MRLLKGQFVHMCTLSFLKALKEKNASGTNRKIMGSCSLNRNYDVHMCTNFANIQVQLPRVQGKFPCQKMKILNYVNIKLLGVLIFVNNSHLSFFLCKIDPSDQ